MSRTRVAVVTGASSGIGRATAEALARKHYAVVLAARGEDRLRQAAEACRELGAETLAVPTDVSRREQVEALVAAAVDRFGRVDVMVNNAGRGLFARVWEVDERQIRELFDVNFFSAFHGCKAVAPIMIRQGGGHIFNVSSVIGKRGTPYHGAYSATKFAICGLSDSLRVELRPSNVRVTCVCPALTDTEFFSGSPRGREAGTTSERWVRKMSPQKVGRKIAATVGKDRPELVFSLGGKALAALATLWPRAADAFMELYRRDMEEIVAQARADATRDEAP